MTKKGWELCSWQWENPHEVHPILHKSGVSSIWNNLKFTHSLCPSSYSLIKTDVLLSFLLLGFSYWDSEGILSPCPSSASPGAEHKEAPFLKHSGPYLLYVRTQKEARRKKSKKKEIKKEIKVILVLLVYDSGLLSGSSITPGIHWN